MFLGAFLGMFSAFELRKTAGMQRFEPRWWFLYWWSDEDSQIFSCSMCMVGNVLFAAGSICFFPKMAFVGGYVIEDERLSTVAATFCFIIGSAFFVAGAMVDLLVLVRAPYKKRPASTETSCLVSSASS